MALQLLYQLVCFALPLEAKWNWYSGAHLGIVEPFGTIAVLASLGAYSVAAWRGYEQWQAWLDQNVSNRDESRLGWLRVILIGIAGTGALGVVMMLVHLLARPLDYFARLPIVVALALLAYLIGLLGFRYGRGAIAMTTLAAESAPPHQVTDGAAITGPHTAVKGYATQAAAWQEQVLTNGWHRDSMLTLTKLASSLDTSQRTLSRTLNEGLGLSFNDFVNRLRVRDAVDRLRQPGASDVLRVALDVGFASKASFNRAFKRHTGTTPTGIRDGETVVDTSQVPPTTSMARAEAIE